jgi:hypothetical protein
MNPLRFLVVSSLLAVAVACSNTPAPEPEKTFTPEEAQPKSA